MNFSTSPKQKDVPNLDPCNIEVGGKIVGDLNPRIYGHGEVTWHAVIHVDGDSLGLLQGHGPTHEAAIEDAIKTGMKRVAIHTQFIRDFSAAIGVRGNEPTEQS